MSTRQIALDLAAFLDSPQAKALEGVSREEARSIAGLFLACCYEDLGKKPHLLDGDDVHMLLGHRMPERMRRKDPLAVHVPGVLEAFFSHLAECEVVARSFEMAQGLASTTGEFLETVRTGENVHHRHDRPKPVVHRVAKLGRNDPCSCGSGKKFKKCHGK